MIKYKLWTREKKYHKIVKSLLINNIMLWNWIFHKVGPTNETNTIKKNWKRWEGVE